MTLLGGITYDPAVAGSTATTAAAAFAAVSGVTAQTFVAPANGAVLVRVCGTVHGAATFPQIMLGVYNSSNVLVARAVALGALKNTALATAQLTQEASFVIPGLTPGNSYTWRPGIGVETGVGSTGLKYGGPDDTVTDNAFGAISFEIHDTPTLLDAKLYDPAVAVAKTCAAALVMTALDTANLRVSFTAPASGKVFVRLRGSLSGATTMPTILLGVLNGATIMGRQSPLGGLLGTALATTNVPHEAEFVVPGLTPGNSYNFDAAYGVEQGVAATNLHYGGPDDTTANNAWGGFGLEVWSVEPTAAILRRTQVMVGQAVQRAGARG